MTIRSITVIVNQKHAPLANIGRSHHPGATPHANNVSKNVAKAHVRSVIVNAIAIRLVQPVQERHIHVALQPLVRVNVKSCV